MQLDLALRFLIKNPTKSKNNSIKIMLSKEIKLKVFYEIINTTNFLGKYEEYDGILTFLTKIWDLKKIPSLV